MLKHMHKHLLDLLITFEWDVGNADKSRRKHNASIKETEEIFANEPFMMFGGEKHSAQETRYLALGTTADGKKLSISFTIRKHSVRIISARPMSKKEEVIYVQKQN